MEVLKKEKKSAGRFLLIACNVVLVAVAVLFTIWYSKNVKASQEELMLENFCNTIETMKQISVRYLSDELESAANWASYIEQEHMTMDEALDYIRAISDPADCEAHIVDMDTYEAWSTNVVGGSNEVITYQRILQLSTTDLDDYETRMQKMYNGEKYLLGKYRSRETQRMLISVGQRVMLRQPDGTDRGYLLLRVLTVDKMKTLWLFPVNYASAEVGLVDDRNWYVIPSKSMRGENFVEFIRENNFADDYYGADRALAVMKEQSSGLLELKDSKGQECYWYYSRLDEFEGLDLLGYIPVSELEGSAEEVSIVIVVAGILLLLVVIDGAYVLNINRKLRATARIAEKASNAKTQFLSTMSHDIRTPLNAVIGMTELAQGHMNDPAYVQECLRKIAMSGNHLLTLINDILEISRVESGRISINPAPMDVRELVGELESITRSQAVGHGVQLEVCCKELPVPCLMGDKLRLTQVYLNLLNNAVKYTNPGGSIRIEVWEERREEDVMLVFVVADTGVGMTAEFQKNMYDSFTRVSDSRIDKIQGSGLGLAIVKRMVDLMHGSIECRSAEGVGTTFKVRIPLQPAQVAPWKLAPEDPAAQQLSGGDLSNLRILVAEDNDINWEIISEMLRGYNMHCDRAENGRKCVEMLNAAPPGSYDLVFMDVQMPLLNGRDATRQLRTGKREDLHKIPVVAMTADAFAEDVQLCLDAGMDGHVAKPVEIEKVLAVIRRLVFQNKSGESR